MSDYEDLKADLAKHRDEIKLKLHLASMDAREEWADLEKRWNDFSSKAQMKESGEAVGGALGQLGHELKQAYIRLKDAI